MCPVAAAVGDVAVEQGVEMKLTMLLVGVVSKGVEEGWLLSPPSFSMTDSLPQASSAVEADALLRSPPPL